MVDCYWTSQFYHKPVRSCFILTKKKARIYAGCGVSQTPKEDFESEVKIVRALAEYGKDAESQNRMGVLYNRGIGLERNDLAALYWFNKAEEQGEAAAGTDCDGIFQAYCRNLGREDFAEQIGLLAHWCRTGRGPVPTDRERGAYWTGRMEKILTGPDRKGRPDA